MYEALGISKKIVSLVEEEEKKLVGQFADIDAICEYNSAKVLQAFQKHRISDMHFQSTTGYGYNDLGREAIEDVFKEVFRAEASLVRGQFISGTHALTVALFALLRPSDTLLSITGKPYDTLDEVIGIRPNPSSLQSFGVLYEQIELVDDDFDYVAIQERLRKGPVRLIEIQRSKGYSTRKTLSISQVEKVVRAIREVDQEVVIMVDNCYCEFVDKKEPLEVGADLIVGSLIKNLGGGIAPNGAYIAGREALVSLAAERLTVPGEGKEVGPTLGINKSFLQGLFLAPSVVASSLKTAVLASGVLMRLGYVVEPLPTDPRSDIVQNIIFADRKKLIRFCQGIQYSSPIDSYVLAEPSDMPGYQDQVIMAAGTFTQGSSIELSCDGPLRPPYIAYLQGGLTYPYGKLAIMKAVETLLQ